MHLLTEASVVLVSFGKVAALHKYNADKLHTKYKQFILSMRPWILLLICITQAKNT